MSVREMSMTNGTTPNEQSASPAIICEMHNCHHVQTRSTRMNSGRRDRLSWVRWPFLSRFNTTTRETLTDCMWFILTSTATTFAFDTYVLCPTSCLFRSDIFQLSCRYDATFCFISAHKYQTQYILYTV